jgi:DNA-binding transcriptional LysR family regulator
MRLRHIEVFHAVYTYGSITAAARFLKVSQPSVSKVLAHAEQQLGYRLFDRIKGKVVPTLEAERLIGHVSGVFQSIEELQKVSENIGLSDKGRIKIAVTPAFGIDLVPSVIASYLARHPETQFEVETLHYHQVIRALNQSRIDLGVAFHPSPTPGITSEHLATAHFVAVTDSEVNFGPAESVKLDQLLDSPFIQLSDRGPLGQLLTASLKSQKVSFNPVVRAETYQFAKALAANGVGMTIIDEVTARSSGHENVCSRKLDPELTFNIALLRLESTPLSIVLQRFIAHLKREVRTFLDQPLNS